MAASRGAIEAVVHESRALRGNALGDPAERTLWVYTPPGYGDRRRYPVLFLLAGFTGRGVSFLNWSAWQETLPERLDRLIGSGALPPCVVALPDCFTRLGGSQYVNSRAQGRYADYLCDELVPLVDQRFRTLGSGARAIAGKSSGGIGALWLCLERPGLFSACASQSGDCAFELSLQPAFASAAVALEQRGGMAAYWAKLARGEPPGPSDHELINTLACAAAYSPPPPEPPGKPAGQPWGFELPFEEGTGVTRAEVFAHWLTFDPLRAAAARPEGLRGLRALHLDAGKSDEFHLQLGARLLSRELTRLGIQHLHDEFEGGHRNTAARWDVSLPLLVRALRAAS
jgi:enterochelin esterase family protein